MYIFVFTSIHSFRDRLYNLFSFCPNIILHSHSKWIIIFVVVTNWFVPIITRQDEGVSLEIGKKNCLRPSSQSKPQGFGVSFLSDYYLYYICSLLMMTFACQNLMVFGSYCRTGKIITICGPQGECTDVFSLQCAN